MNKAYPILAAFTLFACSNSKQEDTETPATESEFTVTEYPDLSVYHLPSKWTTQHGTEMDLRELQGNVWVAVMIYTSCQSACPRLVADMKQIESKVSEKVPEGLRYVLISIDPETDTPERLMAFAEENGLTGPQWLLLRGDEESVREFANITAVRYSKISPIDYSHSNIISLFDRNGEMVFQQEGLGVDYGAVVEKAVAMSK